MSQNEMVLQQLDQGLLTIIMNRPDRRNALNPDIIALTGDYVATKASEVSKLINGISGLKAKYGVFGCLGNHDVWAGAADSITALFRRAGIRILRQERTDIRAGAETCELPALKPRAKRPKPGPPQSNEDMPRFRRSYADDCTTWKVSFRMALPGPRKHRGPRTRSEPSDRRRCRNLACRIEALRRAINSREDYVQRYARRLARIAEANARAVAEALKLHDPLQPTTAAAPPEAAPRSAKHFEPG